MSFLRFFRPFLMSPLLLATVAASMMRETLNLANNASSSTGSDENTAEAIAYAQLILYAIYTGSTACFIGTCYLGIKLHECYTSRHRNERQPLLNGEPEGILVDDDAIAAIEIHRQNAELTSRINALPLPTPVEPLSEEAIRIFETAIGTQSEDEQAINRAKLAEYKKYTTKECSITTIGINELKSQDVITAELVRAEGTEAAVLPQTFIHNQAALMRSIAADNSNTRHAHHPGTNLNLADQNKLIIYRGFAHHIVEFINYMRDVNEKYLASMQDRDMNIRSFRV